MAAEVELPSLLALLLLLANATAKSWMAWCGEFDVTAGLGRAFPFASMSVGGESVNLYGLSWINVGRAELSPGVRCDPSAWFKLLPMVP